MPVTFQTDLNDIKERPYIQQLPLDAMFRGLGFKQAEYDQGIAQAKDITQNVANLLRGYGPDEQVAADIKGQLNQQLQSFANQDFSRPDVVNQFNSYLSGVLNSPDVRGIVSRTSKRENDDRLIRKYQDEGKQVPLWMQTSVQQRSAYESSGVYNPDMRYRGEITVAPDIDGVFLDVLKDLKPDIDASGKEYLPPERIRAALDAQISANPQISDYYNRMFEANHASTNWDNEAGMYNNRVVKQGDLDYNRALNQADYWQSVADGITDKTSAKYKTAISAAQKAAQLADNAKGRADEARINMNSPYSGRLFREKLRKDFLGNQLDDWSSAYSYTQNKLGKAQEMAIAHGYEMAEIDRQHMGDMAEITQRETAKANAKAAALGIDASGSTLMNEFYDLSEGKNADGQSADTNINKPTGWFGGTGYNITTKTPATGDQLAALYEVPTAASKSGDTKWVLINQTPSVIRLAVDKGNVQTPDGIFVRGTMLAQDGETGQDLVFRSADGKKLAYVQYQYKQDGEQGPNQFHIIDENVAKNFAANHSKTTKDERAAILASSRGSRGGLKTTTTKPKTVVQNGVTYTLNETTGKYE